MDDEQDQIEFTEASRSYLKTMGFAAGFFAAIFVFLFGLYGSLSESVQTRLYIRYNLEDIENPNAFIAYASSGSVSFVEESYPLAVIDVVSNVKALGFRSRNGNPVKFGELSKTVSIQMMLSDGSGAEVSGDFYHFPRQPPRQEQSEVIKDIIDKGGYGAKVMEDAWNAKHGIGDSIEENRKELLLGLTYSALSEGGYGYAADMMQSGRSSVQIKDNSVLIKLSIVAVVVGLFVGLITVFSEKVKRTKKF